MLLGILRVHGLSEVSVVYTDLRLKGHKKKNKLRVRDIAVSMEYGYLTLTQVLSAALEKTHDLPVESSP